VHGTVRIAVDAPRVATPRGSPVPDSLPRDQMTTLAWFLHALDSAFDPVSEIGVAQAGSSLLAGPGARAGARVSVPRGQG
jgi:hypothetical protein